MAAVGLATHVFAWVDVVAPEARAHAPNEIPVPAMLLQWTPPVKLVVVVVETPLLVLVLVEVNVIRVPSVPTIGFGLRAVLDAVQAELEYHVARQ